jgi:hypothetical protein
VLGDLLRKALFEVVDFREQSVLNHLLEKNKLERFAV